MNLRACYKESSVIQKIAFLVFVALLVLTAFCNRLSIDDLFFKYRIDTVGLSGIIDHQYSRVMAYFLNGCIIAINNLFVYVLYNLLSIFVFAYLLGKVVHLLLPADYAGKLKFAILFFLFFFFCCSAPSDVFFWYTQVSTYLWCINCILVISYFLKTGFTRKWQLPVFWMACAFAGSSSEFLAVQFLLLLIYLLVVKKVRFSGIKHRIVFITGLVVLIAAVCSTILSPGTEARNHLLNNDGGAAIYDRLLSTSYFFCHHFYTFLLWPHIGYLLLFLFAFFILGNQSKVSLNIVWRDVLAFLCFTTISLLVICYKLNDIAPPRTMIVCDLWALYLLAQLTFNLGNRMTLNKRFLLPLQHCLLLVFILALFSNGADAVLYARAYEVREKRLSNPVSDPIFVNLLPSPYFIHAANISTDSLDFRNQHLRLSHHLRTNIVQPPG